MGGKKKKKGEKETRAPGRFSSLSTSPLALSGCGACGSPGEIEELLTGVGGRDFELGTVSCASCGVDSKSTGKNGAHTHAYTHTAQSVTAPSSALFIFYFYFEEESLKSSPLASHPDSGQGVAATERGSLMGFRHACK